MGKLRFLILVYFLLSSPLAVSAQLPSSQLTPGTPVERQLESSQVHEFTVNLEENSFIQLVVQQRGIDVIVRVFSPSGKSLGEYDSPNGADGPEHVSFVAAGAGSHRITVGPLDPTFTTEGRYEIKILEVREASEQELKASKYQETVKARAIALLGELEGLIAQIKSPPMRIRAQLTRARLLFDVDEKRASKYLSDAVMGMKEYLASIDPNIPDYQRFSRISQLRYDIIQLLAARDPDAALSFLYSTNQISDPSGNRAESLAQQSILELSIADQIMRKDPSRALQIARRNLKSGYSPSLIQTLTQLTRQNPEMASELAGEIAAKLINDKLLGSPEVANCAVNLLHLSRRLERRFQQSAANEKPKPPLLAEDQYKELARKMLGEVLSFIPPPANRHTPGRESAWVLLMALQQMGPSLDTIAPGGEAAVQKKTAEFNTLNNPNFAASRQLGKTIANSPLDVSLAAIEKAPPELKDQLYIELANHAFNKGDSAGARQIINDNITSPHQRRQALANLDQQELSRAMNAGKVEEALRTIASLRSSRERAVHLAQMVHQIGSGQKRATAILLLEQARSLLGQSIQARDQDQMNALLEIARAFSRFDVKRSFEIVDPLIDQFNELSTAARTLDGFGPEYYEDEELDLDNGSSIAVIAHQLSRVLGTLALTNFEGASAATERIRQPEARLRIYLEIAEQGIKGVAR